MLTYRINELKLLELLAHHLANTLPKGVLYLVGDLGSGKTTFTQFFIKQLGYGGVVNSPTYALMNLYKFSGYSIIHADLYRLGQAEELLYLDVDDWQDMADILLIEWAARGEPFLPPPDMVCRFEFVEGNRWLSLEAKTVAAQKALDGLKVD